MVPEIGQVIDLEVSMGYTIQKTLFSNKANPQQYSICDLCKQKTTCP